VAARSGKIIKMLHFLALVVVREQSETVYKRHFRTAELIAAITVKRTEGSGPGFPAVHLQFLFGENWHSILRIPSMLWLCGFLWRLLCLPLLCRFDVIEYIINFLEKVV
jgi:hypothetical protein